VNRKNVQKEVKIQDGKVAAGNNQFTNRTGKTELAVNLALEFGGENQCKR